MPQYKIITDSTSNLTDELIEQYDIEMLSYPYIYNSEVYNCYEKGRNYAAFGKYFYDLVRQGAKVRTSLINEATLEECFEAHLANGYDVLFIGMSSGLTGTVLEARKAAEILNAQYENKCYIIDSMGASLGEGIMVIEAAKRRAQGETISEVIAWYEGNKFKMRHIFTVDNLIYLKNGGRISATTAVAGNLLGIKPILMADDNGKIIMADKVRGRKKSLEKLALDVAEHIRNAKEQIIGIAHCDCEEDAALLKQMIQSKIEIAAENFLTIYYDLCSGTHVGPGAIAVFFMGENREK